MTCDEMTPQDAERLLDAVVGDDETPDDAELMLDAVAQDAAPEDRSMTIEELEAVMEYRCDAKGNPTGYKSSTYNATLVLQNDDRTWRAIALDEFSGRIKLMRDIDLDIAGLKPIKVIPGRTEFSDAHEAAFSTFLAAAVNLNGWGIKLNQRDLYHALANTAAANAFHPILDQIRSIKWDGVSRVDGLFGKYLGLDDNEYHRQVSRIFFVGAVARLVEPGMKFDFVPVIVGGQGGRKSSFVKALSLGFFGEIKERRDIVDEKVLMEKTEGAWIVEIPEFDHLLAGDPATIKAALTSETDRARGAYSRNPENRPRRQVFIGTTNTAKNLNDPTGGRRFLLLNTKTSRANMIDIERLREEMPQVWAEALAIYHRMRAAQPLWDLPLYLTGEAQQHAERLQSAARVETVEDTIAGWAQDWLETPVAATAHAAKAMGLIEINGALYRGRVCARQVFEAYHRGTNPDAERVPEYTQAQGRLIGKALEQVPFLADLGNRHSYETYGRQRSYETDAEALTALLGPAPAVPAVSDPEHWDHQPASAHDDAFGGWDENDAFEAAASRAA